MAVRIRLKRLGRRHRPFYRVCAMDGKSPRDGRALEELGTYDPMIRETDARALLNGERIAYWVSQGAQPTDKVQVLINKYGKDGTHLDAQQTALERLRQSKPTAPPAEPLPKFEEETPPAAAVEDAPAEAAPAEAAPAEGAPAEAAPAEEAPAEAAPAEEAPAEAAPAEAAPAEEAPAEEAPAEEAPAEEAPADDSTEDAPAEEAAEADSEEEKTEE